MNLYATYGAGDYIDLSAGASPSPELHTLDYLFDHPMAARACYNGGYREATSPFRVYSLSALLRDKQTGTKLAAAPQRRSRAPSAAPETKGPQKATKGQRSGPEQVTSVVRSFAILTALNAKNGSTVSQLAAMTDLPRATTYRILATLVTLGYVERGDDNGAFFLTSHVLDLSKGIHGQGWVNDYGKALISTLANDVVWPVSLIIPRESTMVMRLSSDFESPMIETRFHTGMLSPLLATAAGYTYLAFSPPDVREDLISASMADSYKKLRGTPAQLAAFRAALPNILERGYAFFSGYAHNAGLKRTAAFAVPIMHNKKVVGCLSMRFFASVLTKKALEEKYVPIFKDAARSLEAKIG
jgi:IclR family transcriptional regulator, mhp operon transcriptional activator